MQEGRRLVRIRELVFQLRISRLEPLHLLDDAFDRTACLDSSQQLSEFAFDPRKLVSHGSEARSTLNPQQVHLAGKLIAEFPEQLRLHQVRPQAAPHREVSNASRRIFSRSIEASRWLSVE